MQEKSHELPEIILTLCLLGNFSCCLSSADCFQNQLFQKILSGIPCVSNRMDPDQARHFVGPELGPNCLHRLSADETYRVNAHLFIFRQQSWPWIGVGVST